MNCASLQNKHSLETSFKKSRSKAQTRVTYLICREVVNGFELKSKLSKRLMSLLLLMTESELFYIWLREACSAFPDLSQSLTTICCQTSIQPCSSLVMALIHTMFFPPLMLPHTCSSSSRAHNGEHQIPSCTAAQLLLMTPKPAIAQPSTLGPLPKAVDKRGGHVFYQGEWMICSKHNNLECNFHHCRFLFTCLFCMVLPQSGSMSLLLSTNCLQAFLPKTELSGKNDR